MQAARLDGPTLLPIDHPDRRMLADEVHARPPESLGAPASASHIALVVPPGQRAQELVHLAALCQKFGVSAPVPDAIHFRAEFAGLRLKWERHSEFSTYTFFAHDHGPATFQQPPVSMLPREWVQGLPGATIFAAHARLIALDDAAPDASLLASYFENNTVMGARIGGGGGMAFTDFRFYADGFSRFLVCNHSFTPRQAGTMIQRLFEIETYRMMAMLALPLARAQAKRLTSVEASLAALTDDIARQSVADEALLQQLTNLAAEVESCLAASQFRFGACTAYHDLVVRRIAELREDRLDGMQTIEEFMARRFTPAVATCASTSQRLHGLSERVAQASGLLSTRVDIAREQQNHRLLDSMNRRARSQLRLQQTVEILSAVPITYYLVGLVGYLCRSLKMLGYAIDPERAEGLSTPLVAALVVLALWRAHRKLADHGTAP